MSIQDYESQLRKLLSSEQWKQTGAIVNTGDKNIDEILDEHTNSLGVVSIERKALMVMFAAYGWLAFKRFEKPIEKPVEKAMQSTNRRKK